MPGEEFPMKGKLVRWLIAMIAIQLVCGAGQALAATTRIVDDNYPVPQANCPGAMYNSIQVAVLASAPGDTVLVCPGTYEEQVKVPAGKNDLTIRSKVAWAAIIKAPPVMVATDDGFTIVEVSSSTNVSILGFTITGPGPIGCGSLHYGVFVGGGGSANIVGNHITAIRDQYDLSRGSTELSGCQNGVAVRVGRNFTGQVGRANVVGNLLDDYQKGGVVIDGPGSFGFVSSNQVVGFGPAKIIAQNGIQVSRKAVATVDRNNVRLHQFAPFPPNPVLAAVPSEGILLFGASTPGTVISNNRVTDNDENIAASVDLITQDIFGADVPTANVKFLNNTALNAVKYDGIFMDEFTFNNRIENNFARNNKVYDCEDLSHGGGTSSTANFWIHNDGFTQSPPGICRAGRGDDRGHHHHHGDADD
jgi:hypothetical protein